MSGVAGSPALHLDATARRRRLRRPLARAKKSFTKSIPPEEHRSATRLHRAERGIWQRRFWEHTIRDERDYVALMDYIHFNPVKHRLVKQARDWEYSSFRRCAAAGLYPAQWDWAGGDTMNAGERE